MLSIVLCLLLSPVLALSAFLPQAMTLVPIALLLLLGYVGPVSAVTCTAVLITLSTTLFGFWGAALSTLLLVPVLGLPGAWIAMAVELCVRGLLMLYRHRTTKYYGV